MYFYIGPTWSKILPPFVLLFFTFTTLVISPQRDQGILEVLAFMVHYLDMVFYAVCLLVLKGTARNITNHVITCRLPLTGPYNIFFFRTSYMLFLFC